MFPYARNSLARPPPRCLPPPALPAESLGGREPFAGLSLRSSPNQHRTSTGTVARCAPSSRCAASEKVPSSAMSPRTAIRLDAATRPEGSLRRLACSSVRVVRIVDQHHSASPMDLRPPRHRFFLGERALNPGRSPRRKVRRRRRTRRRRSARCNAPTPLISIGSPLTAKTIRITALPHVRHRVRGSISERPKVTTRHAALPRSVSINASSAGQNGVTLVVDSSENLRLRFGDLVAGLRSDRCARPRCS